MDKTVKYGTCLWLLIGIIITHLQCIHSARLGSVCTQWVRRCALCRCSVLDENEIQIECGNWTDRAYTSRLVQIKCSHNVDRTLLMMIGRNLPHFRIVQFCVDTFHVIDRNNHILMENWWKCHFHEIFLNILSIFINFAYEKWCKMSASNTHCCTNMRCNFWIN